MPSPWFTGLDDDGTPLSGGLLYTYVAGSVNTPLATYSDVDLLIPNANPVVLDAAGRATVYLQDASYKFVLRRSDGSLVRTGDNISAVSVGQSSSLGMVFVLGGTPDSPIVAVAYPSGAGFDKLHAGTAVFNVDSGDLVGTYQFEAMLRCDGGAEVDIAIVNLTDGAPDTPLATASGNSVTGERVRSGNITFAAAGSAKDYGIKVKVDVGSAYVWGIKLIRTS